MAEMSDFMPHGSCFLWHADILTLHVASDALIALAYFCIPFLTLRSARVRNMLWPFAWAFSAFIFACGITHVMDVWTIWHPDYWLAGAFKAVCAVASVGTALALLPFMPYAAAIGKISALDARNAELESQFVHVVETTTDGVWIFDSVGNTVRANERIAAMLGYAPSELVGRSMFDFMPPSWLQRSQHPFPSSLPLHAGERTFCFERKDGAQVWTEMYFHPTYDGHDSFIGAVATVVDISERRRVQASLEESERRYRSLAEAMPQMVWTADATGRVRYSNQNWRNFTGTTFGESAADSIWTSVIHPLDLPSFRENLANSLLTGQEHEAEYRLLRVLDGTFRWHICRVVPVRQRGGSVEQWVGSFTDIHDYKVALQTREILDLIGDIVLICGDDDVTVYANPLWIRYTGASTTSFGFRWRNFIHPDDLKAFDLHKRERYEIGLDMLEYELRIRGQNGEYRWFLVRTAALPGLPIQPRRWLKTLTDIEDLKRVQTALTREVEETKKAEAILTELHHASVAATEAKSRFLATMSHEIRTPMNGVVGMSELLMLSKLDAEQFECARVIHDSSSSLLRILNDILDYSKIEAGKLELEEVDFQLNDQIESVVGLLKPQFAARNITLTTHCDPSLPAHLSGDPGRLRQILLNLVGNALKFTPSGGTTTIGVEWLRDEEDRVVVRFTVEDTGIGIPETVVSRLFQPFSQADGSTTRRYGGTGLGLSISAQLVTLMQGSIGVQSTVGEGSLFWFVVPFARAAGGAVLEAAADEAGLPSLPERPRLGHGGTIKILVADDNSVNLVVARKQFAQLGHAIATAANGFEAIAAVEREAFDIVFMDCHMPELDGLQATERIRSREAHAGSRVPIIAMTADARDDDRLRCLAAGMDDYISKPTSLATLAAMLDRWVPSPQRGPAQPTARTDE